MTNCPGAGLVDALIADPWLAPSGASKGKPSLRSGGRVGNLRGFGGLFMAPRGVACPDRSIVVSDGDDRWLLFADRFGASFQRVGAASRSIPKMAPPYFQLILECQLTKGNTRAPFPQLTRSQSSAARDPTLAVATSLSHAIFLVAVVSS